MVVNFMTLDFRLEALMTLYGAQSWITGVLGSSQPFGVVIPALIGVPVYTNNLTALSLVGSLIT